MGEKTPLMTMDNVTFYSADRVVTAAGSVYEPLADGYELSSLPDCSETLRAVWRELHPTPEQRVAELEALVAELLFGGDAV